MQKAHSRPFLWVLAALGILSGAVAHAQTPQQVGPPYFPPTLPSGTVVGRIQAGTGPAAAITLSQLAGAIPVVTSAPTNVQNFGWVCDGTDHSTQAQNAITTLANIGGGTLYFPPCPVATFTESLSGTSMTVTNATGTIVIGSLISGEGILPNISGTGPQRLTARTSIVAQVSGTPGGNGVYTISQSGNSSGGQALSMPCYRADSQLTVPLYPTSSSQQFGGGPSGPSIRFTGAGASASLGNMDDGANSNSASACIDLRDKSHIAMSGVGFTVDGGSGYTSGTGNQTLTLAGGSGPVASFGSITAGSGGTPGTYNNVWLVCKSGQPCHGSGVKATVVVAGGGGVSSVSCSANCGGGYLANDVLTINTIVGPAGVPSNFSVPVATITDNTNCSVKPTWKVVVSGGVVQGGAQPSIGYSSNSSSIGSVTSGTCTVVPQNPVTVTSSDSGTGATFLIYWTGGKLQTLGGGAVEIDHLSIVDANTTQNSEAMVYTTNSMLNIHDTVFGCSADPNQDAIVMGGLLGSGHIVPPNNTPDSSSLGFGSIISRNVFDGCNRIAFARTFNALTTITNNIANGTCAGDRFIELMSAQGPALYPYVANNYTEGCNNLRYGVVLNTVSGGFFANNSTVDISGIPTYQYDYYPQDASGSSTYSTVIAGYGCSVVISSLPLCQTFPTGGESITGFNIVGPQAGALNMSTQGNQGNSIAAWMLQTFVNGANWNTALCPPAPFSVSGGGQAAMVTMGNYTALQTAAIDSLSPSTCGATNLVLNPAGGFVTLQSYVNDGSTGTSNGFLAKFTTDNPSKIILPLTTDTSGIMGIVVGGGGTTGSGTAVSIGKAWCFFDNTATAGDYVQISSSAAGKCHDAGSTLPTSGQIIGQALANGTGLQNVFVNIQTPLPTQNFGGHILNTGITTDSGQTATATVCEDTTTHQFYFGSGTAGVCKGTSSIRFKHGVAPLTEGLAQIMAMQPVRYYSNDGYGDPSKPLNGLLAEDMEHVSRVITEHDGKGDPISVDYVGIIPVLINAIKQQQAEIEALKAARH